MPSEEVGSDAFRSVRALADWLAPRLAAARRRGTRGDERRRRSRSPASAPSPATAGASTRSGRGLASGATAIGDFQRFDHSAYRTHVASEVDGAFALDAVARAERTTVADRFALFAAGEALAAVGPARAARRARRRPLLRQLDRRHARGRGLLRRLHRRRPAPRFAIGSLAAQQPSGPGDAVARHFGVTGPVVTISSACASATLAFGSALDALRSGEVDVALVGGADSLCRLTFAGFNSLRAVDPRPCRPFRAEREGMSIGEGAAVLVLESRAHAERRGARVARLARRRRRLLRRPPHDRARPAPATASRARSRRRSPTPGVERRRDRLRQPARHRHAGQRRRRGAHARARLRRARGAAAGDLDQGRGRPLPRRRRRDRGGGDAALPRARARSIRRRARAPSTRRRRSTSWSARRGRCPARGSPSRPTSPSAAPTPPRSSRGGEPVSASRRVVATGLGVVGPAGVGREALAARARRARRRGRSRSTAPPAITAAAAGARAPRCSPPVSTSRRWCRRRRRGG